MLNICRLTVLFFAIACGPAAFGQYNHQLLPDDMAAALRRVMAPVEGTAFLHAYFSDSEMGNVAVVGIADKGTSCPVMFRIVYPDSSPRYPQYHVTKEFGDCTENPTIEFDWNKIIFRFSGWPKSERHLFVPPTAYVFTKRTLRQLNPQRPKARRT